MIASIHQPSYWPWLGSLDKVAKAATFVILDHVAANKGAYQYRNIFLCNGKPKMITLPVNFRTGVRINELEFTNALWRIDHVRKLSNYYAKTPFFREVFPEVELLYGRSHERPVDLIIDTMMFSFKVLGIHSTVLRSSELNIEGHKADLNLNIVKKVGCDVYLSGRGALDYMSEGDIANFEKEGIQVVWQDFHHPEYSQFPGQPFIEGLACIDLFFFHGFEGSRKIFSENIQAPGFTAR